MNLRWGRSQGRQTVLKVAGGVIYTRSAGEEPLGLRLEEIGARLHDMQPVLDEYGRYLVNTHIPAQFAALGTPARWAPLSLRYARWKALHHPGQPLLVRTGAMKAGFHWNSGPRSLRIVNRIRAGQSGGEPRWQYHQWGTAQLPARPVIQLTNKDRRRLQELAEEYIAA